MFSASTIAILVLSAIVAAGLSYVGGKWAFGKDTEVEERRRAAFTLAATLQTYGLVRIPAFLGDYAVGDYSGMFSKIHDLAKLALAGEEAIVKELEQVHANILARKLASPEGRAFLQAKIDEYKVQIAPAVEAKQADSASMKTPVVKS